MKRLSWMAAVVVAGTLAGCGPKIKPATADLGGAMLTVGQMAGRLNLQVASSSGATASLADRYNRVSVFGNPGSRVLVNGQKLTGGDRIITSRQGLLIDEELVLQVRSLLRGPAVRPAYIPPQPAPVETTPSPRGLSGTVVIDPGHGGQDPGAGLHSKAHTPSRTVEKDLVLDVALQVASILEQQGLRVILTRRGDQTVGLEERAAIANRARADLFVAIHVDSLPRKPSVNGVTAWIARSASRQAAAAAQTICGRVESAGLSCRGINRADFKVLVLTRCPSVLLEIGFLSNSAEARMLDTASHRSRVAAAIADGIARHMAKR